MPLTPRGFLPPDSPLREEWFPGDDLPSFLLAWIKDAEARAASVGVATDGPAARAWVLHLAWARIANRLMYAPASVSVDKEGSRSRNQAQLDHFIALRDAARLEAGRLASAYAEPEAANPRPVYAPVRSLR